ncbi:MAG: tetratricopeptide repeat protein [Bacteroidota bacterium]
MKNRLTGVAIAIVLIIVVWILFIAKSNDKFIKEKWEAKKEIIGNLTINYPQDKTIFPPEITSQTFRWKDSLSSRWFISLSSGTKEIINSFSDKSEWKPLKDQWELIKKVSSENEITVSIIGFDGNEIVSSDQIEITTSKDSVNASIFYRDVPLPFEFASKNMSKIKWRLGEISSESGSKVMMSDLPVCGNCHSFSADGEKMAMDVDYANDKGSYVIAPIEKETVLSLDEIITWSDYKRDDGKSTFGLLSKISPSGRYVASTVKDRSIFVPQDDLLYSQLFFPIRGIIVIYDTETEEFWALPGADDPNYVQSNPEWSPDEKYLIFAKAPIYESEEIENTGTAIMPKEIAEVFTSGEKDFKYDLYKIPFNKGKGGKPIPINGASFNNKSNYFPKISPNGKWLVFTQSDNFMLLQPDSKLNIIPTNGGEPREMICNNNEMNSWHSWSPNSKWLVFSSKENGPYTQLYLTHIDANGNDSPPVLIENFVLKERAANIPEFVNIRSDSWNRMVDAFTDSSNYRLRVGHNELYYGEIRKAIDEYTIAIKQNPNDFEAYVSRAVAYKRARNYEGSLEDYDSALELKPNDKVILIDIGDVKYQLKDYKGAIEAYTKYIEFRPNEARTYSARGVSKSMTNNLEGSISDFNKAIQLDPTNAEYVANRGISYRGLGKIENAISDFEKATEIDDEYYPAFNMLGDIYFQRGNVTKATWAYENCNKLKPEDSKTLHKLGDSYFRNGEFQEAIERYTESLEIRPNNADIFLSRGVCRINIKDYSSALIDFDKCLQINPNDNDALYNRGDVKYRMKNYLGAIEDFNIVINNMPKFAQAYYKRGLSNREINVKDRACNDFKQANSLGHEKAQQELNKYCK